MRPLGGRAKAAVALLVLGMLTDVGALAADGGQYNVLEDLRAGIDVDPDVVASSDRWMGITGIAQVAVFLVGVVVFLLWFHRAYRNAVALGGRQRYGTGWAIGAWFVPILNFFRPKQIANDIWKATDHEARHTGKLPALLNWWWGLFILNGILGRVAASASLTATTLAEQQTAIGKDVWACFADLVASALAIAVVLRITRRQERARGERPETAAGAPPVVAAPSS